MSPRSPEGHDVAAFLHDVNDECDPPACTPFIASTLKRRALLMLADPLLAYAAYGWAWSYLIRGRTSAALPMIPLPHDVRYLPALHFEMTPYGTALTTEQCEYAEPIRRSGEALLTIIHAALPALRGLRVLCVDDHATNRTILEAQLTAWHLQVDCVADGPRTLPNCLGSGL